MRNLLLWITLALLGLPQPVSAHVGPPFVVLPEQMLGPYRVTVWADPDVGTGTLLIETSIQNLPPPPDTQATVTVWPANQPDAQTVLQATRQTESKGAAFVATPNFERAGPYVIRLQLRGSAPPQDVTFNVEATPAYPTWIEALPCLLPFVAIGGLWWWGVQRQRRAGETRQATKEGTSEEAGGAG